MFEGISLRGWRQFQAVDIKFHPQLTVLTGANGSGKSTILHLLNRHVGWNVRFVSTPAPRGGAVRRFLSGFWGRVQQSDTQPSGFLHIGEVTYRAEKAAQIFVPEDVAEVYDVHIIGQQNVPGLFVASHRPIYAYQPVETIPMTVDPASVLLQRYVGNVQSRYVSGLGGGSASLEIKKALISLAVFGYGSQIMEADTEAADIFEGFQQSLRTILPPSLGFERFEIRRPEVVLKTTTGDFPLESASGGVSALIDLAWQIYLTSRLHHDFVVLIDEPENHLHPELQRRVLPSLIEAFPNAQFICATHNPFIVSAVPESNVYVLKYTSDRTVVSDSLDIENKAGSSNEILRDVLGLPNTLPLWVEEKLQHIVNEYAPAQLNEATLAAIKADLAKIGMSDLLPEALSRVLDEP